MGKSLTKETTGGRVVPPGHINMEFHKVPKCCVRQGTVRVGMKNHWMGMGVLDGGMWNRGSPLSAIS